MDPTRRFATTLAPALLVLGGIIGTLAVLQIFEGVFAVIIGRIALLGLVVAVGGLTGGAIAACLFPGTAPALLAGASVLAVGGLVGVATRGDVPIGQVAGLMGFAGAATVGGAGLGRRLPLAPWLVRSVASAMIQVATIFAITATTLALTHDVSLGLLIGLAAMFFGGALTVRLVPEADVATTTAGWVLVGVVAVGLSVIAATEVGGSAVLLTAIGMIFTLPVPIVAAAIGGGLAVRRRPAPVELAMAAVAR